MPHLILEISANVIEKNDVQNLFRACHEMLVKDIAAAIDSCKSRLYVCDQFYAGDGNAQNAFAHLSVKIMPGRDEQTLKLAGNNLLALMKNHFAESFAKLNMQFTVEIMNLSTSYFKLAK